MCVCVCPFTFLQYLWTAKITLIIITVNKSYNNSEIVYVFMFIGPCNTVIDEE